MSGIVWFIVGLCIGLALTHVSVEKSAAGMYARRYFKLRNWMTTNRNGPWERVCGVAAVGCYCSWDDFDAALDSLPEVPK